jgi:hypothetical protein
MCTSKSAIGRGPGFALEVNMLWKRRTRQRLTNAVITDIGDFTQAFEEAERLKNAGINTDADACVSGFDPLEG